MIGKITKTMKSRLNDLPETELQQSTITIEEIQRKASGYMLNLKNNKINTSNMEVDMFLCLANEIVKLKEEIKTLKYHLEYTYECLAYNGKSRYYSRIVIAESEDQAEKIFKKFCDSINQPYDRVVIYKPLDKSILD